MIMSIKNKIIIPLLILLTILFGIFIYSIFSLNNLINELERTIQQTQKVNDITNRIGYLKQDIRQNVLAFAAFNDRRYIVDIDSKSREVFELLSDVKLLITSKNGKKLLSKYQVSLEESRLSRTKYMSDVSLGDTENSIKSLRAWEVKSQNNHAILLDLQNYNLHALERDHHKFVQLFNQALYTIVLLIILTASILIFFYFYLQRILIKPLVTLVQFAKDLSAGKFGSTISYSSNDELNELSSSLNSMARKLESYYMSLKKNIDLKELELIKIKDLDAQKDNFLNIASHELKTPVTTIKIYTQLLERKLRRSGSDDYREFFNKINEQISSINNLVSSLLDATKIRAGKMPFTFKHYDINQVLKDKIDIALQTTRKHKIILHGRVSKKIYGDKERIGQVINNLLSNAIKYSPKGGQISVIAEEMKKEVVVSVKDQGIGLSSAQQKKIFGRFFRAVDPESSSIPGLGIGLYISSEIVKYHDGRIWVESEKGKGSTFFFSIPFKSKKK